MSRDIPLGHDDFYLGKMIREHTQGLSLWDGLRRVECPTWQLRAPDESIPGATKVITMLGHSGCRNKHHMLVGSGHRNSSSLSSGHQSLRSRRGRATEIQVRQAQAPSRGSGRGGPSCLFQLLGAPGVPGLVAPSLPSLPPSLCGFSSASVSPFFLFQRHLSLDSGPRTSRMRSLC